MKKKGSLQGWHHTAQTQAMGMAVKAPTALGENPVWFLTPSSGVSPMPSYGLCEHLDMRGAHKPTQAHTQTYK